LLHIGITLKKLKNITEKLYYENEFLKYSHDIKKTWGIIGSIINNQSGPATIDVLMTDGRKVTDPIEIAKLFNGYFSGVGRSLEQKIPQGQKQIEEYQTPSLSFR